MVIDVATGKYYQARIEGARNELKERWKIVNELKGKLPAKK